ncbi:MAG TPA: helix-turn-helix domain-containing protein [Thermoanaerobaculia bacterium]|nr:helix-turn-helix domain-containing protein [Thermoanaerobaculia bacterium]
MIPVRPSTIAADLVAVLDEIGCTLESIPRKMRVALEAIAVKSHAPRVADLEAQWPSRRSFYRVWRECIAEPPSAFLRRLRSHHARRLLGGGHTKKEAAHHAGFNSVDSMRRNLK